MKIKIKGNKVFLSKALLTGRLIVGIFLLPRIGVLSIESLYRKLLQGQSLTELVIFLPASYSNPARLSPRMTLLLGNRVEFLSIRPWCEKYNTVHLSKTKEPAKSRVGCHLRSPA